MFNENGFWPWHRLSYRRVSCRSAHNVRIGAHRVLGRRHERGYFIGDWYDAAPDGIWSKGHGILQFRLSPEQRSRYHAASLQLTVLVGTKKVRYRIRSGSHEHFGTFPAAALPRVETFEEQVLLQGATGGIERIELITSDAVRPVDIGFNDDTRVFGLGVVGMTLIP